MFIFISRDFLKSDKPVTIEELFRRYERFYFALNVLKGLVFVLFVALLLIFAGKLTP